MQKLLLIVVSFLLLFAGNPSHAQSYPKKRLSLEINIGALQSVGKDILKTYQSNIQPLTIEYFSRKRFERIYFNLLPNLTYAVNNRVSLGVQSGIYAHFYERYSGYTKPIFVTVPLMATARINITNIKSNKLGISMAGGKNFFNVDTYPYNLKNGWLLNTSFFYLINQKSIIKLGVDKQIDNGYVYHTPSNEFGKNETFKHNLNRVSIMLSYAIVIKQF